MNDTYTEEQVKKMIQEKVAKTEKSFADGKDVKFAVCDPDCIFIDDDAVDTFDEAVEVANNMFRLDCDVQSGHNNLTIYKLIPVSTGKPSLVFEERSD